jgi:galactose mutarotase-like enzyme
MNLAQNVLSLDGVPIVRLESERLRADIAPSVGGRVVSLVDKASGYEFLWRNHKLPLKLMPPGAEYDPNFYGGIDELFPNDIPETINGIPCPDHGELWTLPLTHRSEGGSLKLQGTLPRFGLTYEREMFLREDAPQLDLSYRISNPSPEPRQFLWKMHAALAVQAGDIIDCPAQKAQVADLNWSRYRTLEPFRWPNLQGQAANVVPAADGTVDFFYLFDLTEGRIAWRRPGSGLKFEYQFDTRVFPYAWIFASYGGFDGHYMAIIEPCTCMPISVNDAALRKQCSFLQPGESIETRVSIRAERAG